MLFNGVMMHGNLSDDPSLPWLVTTIQEAFFIHKAHPDDQMYFAPIGTYFSGVDWVHEGQEMVKGEYSFPIRRLLRVSIDSPLVAVAKTFPYYLLDDQIIFYCSVPTSPFLPMNYGFIDEKGTMKARVSFRANVPPWSFVHATSTSITLSNGTSVLEEDRKKLLTRTQVIGFLARWKQTSEEIVAERLIRDVLRELALGDADSDLYDEKIFQVFKVMNEIRLPVQGVRACGSSCIFCNERVDLYPKGRRKKAGDKLLCTCCGRVVCNFEH